MRDIPSFQYAVLGLYDPGREINFFSDSHLAPKFFKVVANSKKLVAIFKDKQILFFSLSSF